MPPVNLELLSKQLQFPGMTWVESRIAQAWIRAHGAAFDSIDFNYRLGEGVDATDILDPSTRGLVKLLTQKRADLIAQNAERVVIVEVKERCSSSVIGQLEVYRDLWLRRPDERRDVRLVAIARYCVPDVAPTFARHNIEIELFPQVPNELQSL